MQRIPFRFLAEYRGVTRKPGEFERDGRTIQSPARLTFEHRDEAGTVVLVDLPASGFDRTEPPADWASFSIGEKMTLAGVCVVQDRGSDKDSYVQLQAVLPAGKS